MPRIKDWTTVVGEKYGRLRILELSGRNKHGHMLVKCQCDCGNISIIEATRVTNGITLSCGCLRIENISNISKTHGLTNTRLYRIWGAMINRCENPNNNRFYTYGAKGIVVCDTWRRDFKAFYDWAMENGYEENLTIDRIDVNGNYEPSNCRWATAKEQANNKKNSRIIDYNGETKNVKEWATHFGFNYKYFHEKLADFDWKIEKVLELPYFKERLKCV